MKADSRTLILECRDGWAAEEALRRVRRGVVDGVDASDKLIALARQFREIQGRLEFHTWDRRSLPFPVATFDTVISTFSMHRYATPTQVLIEAERVLVPGGSIFVLEPMKYSFGGLYLLVDWFYRFRDPGHFRYYTRHQLLDMLTAAGFENPRVLQHFVRFRFGGKLLANGVLVKGRKRSSATQSASASSRT